MSLPLDSAARKLWQLWTYLTEYFPDAFLAEVEVSIVGNKQHNGNEPLHWLREKSNDHMNTAMRHMWDHKFSGPLDTDGCYHLAKARWRLGAALQLQIEADRKAAYTAGQEIRHGNQDKSQAQGSAAPGHGNAGRTFDPRYCNYESGTFPDPRRP